MLHKQFRDNLFPYIPKKENESFPPSPLLTAALIVKNEENLLVGCLESIQPIVDEIVVVDTGSTDQSKKIAKDYHARVIDFQWCQDFSAARNAALARSNGKWVLSIDADERIKPISRIKIRQLLSNSNEIAFKLLYYPKPNHTPYREYRLFRNDPRIRFSGVIHESIIPSLSAFEPVKIGECDLGISHVNLPDKCHQKKLQKYLPLLTARIQMEPENIYCRWHMGIIYKGLDNMSAAVAAWKKAIEIIRKKVNKKPVDSLPYVELLRFYHQKDKVEARQILEEALAFFPNQCLLVWIKAKLLMQAQKFAEAIPFFEYILACDPELPDGGNLSYDKKIFQINAFDGIAQCYYKCGRYEESLVFYDRCMKVEPKNIEYKIKRRFVSTLVKKSGVDECETII